MSTASSSAPQSLDIVRVPLLGRLIGKAMRWGYRLTGKDRYDDYCLERIDGSPFLVTPSVFNPKVPRTGEFLASTLDASTVSRDSSVLDMGTGSGVCAIFAAKYAARVVAVDINPAAVRCAGINVLLNHVEHKVEVRHGDLFDAVPGEQFDVILFNPPFLRGMPRDDRDKAWRSVDVAERFAAGLRDRLKPEGFALVLLSTFGDAGRFLAQFYKAGLGISVQAERRFVNETLIVFKLVAHAR
jgi:release factor glutamine methyltransferase